MKTRLAIVSLAMVHGILAAPAQEKGLLFAHRGGAREFDENTLDAFRSSYEKGLRGFETDVRMTKDGELVILHDDNLERTYNATGHVEDKTAAELRTVTSKKTGQPFLFLEELLSYFDDRPGVYLELEMKTGNKTLYPDAHLNEYCRKLHEAVQAHRPKDSVYVCTSFDERPLTVIRTLDADADLLLISDGPCCPELMKRAQNLGVKRFGCRIEQTSRAAVQAAQEEGFLVSVWPGQSLQDYHLAVGLGVDAICSDIPVAIQAWKAKHE
jgi:glycerophosphoryl diester phosphodiesterase